MKSYPSLVVALTLALGACTTMLPDTKVDGWPDLAITVHNVDSKTMRDHCVAGTAWWGSPMACSEWDLVKKTCDIYVVDGYLLEHEMEHCKGYNHPGGGSSMKEGVKAMHVSNNPALGLLLF